MTASPAPWIDTRGFISLLLNGAPESRRAAALYLLQDDDQSWLRLLVDTVHSDEEWRLRARCLEVLGLAAGAAEHDVAQAILLTVCTSTDAAS